MGYFFGVEINCLEVVAHLLWIWIIKSILQKVIQNTLLCSYYALKQGALQHTTSVLSVYGSVLPKCTVWKGAGEGAGKGEAEVSSLINAALARD